MKYKAVFLLGVGILILSGCAITKKDKSSQSQAILEPQAILKFSDVPIPVGFTLLPSYAFENSGVRVGVLKYQGKADIDKVINFYKEQMPMYNWSLLNIVEYGERLMNFDRENETCIIRLSTKQGFRGVNTIITVSLGPKPQVSKKPNKPVK